MTPAQNPTPPKYTILDCVVLSSQVYGVVVETDQGMRGYIDSEFIADAPASRDEWPEPGSRLRVMVLGRTSDGRLILSARDSDLILIDSLSDPDAGMGEWQTVKEAGADSVSARDRFFRSSNAIPLLRWAISRLPGTTDRQLAQALLLEAPTAIAREISPR